MFQGKHSDLTEQIIGAFFTVYNELGFGFSESVYENAMFIELEKRGLEVEKQKPIQVFYNGRIVGQYFADLLVNKAVILELKAVRQILKVHEAQLLNYLKATSYEVGLVLNFGLSPEHSRKVFDNHRKGSLKWMNPSSTDFSK